MLQCTTCGIFLVVTDSRKLFFSFTQFLLPEEILNDDIDNNQFVIYENYRFHQIFMITPLITS